MWNTASRGNVKLCTKKENNASQPTCVNQADFFIMSKYQISKIQALKLLTPVVDGEASEAERQAFMEFIAQNEDVRNRYHTMKKLKSMVTERCPRAKAPDSLRNRVSNFLREVEEEDPTPKVEPPIYDIPCNGPGSNAAPRLSRPNNNTSGFKSRNWLFSSAATMLVMLILGGYFNVNTPSQEVPGMNMEEKIYEHFIENKGQYIEPTISTASLGSAESRLFSDYNISMKVPEVQNSTFKGVVVDEFIPSYQAPLLEYHLESEDQYIYIFAFELNKLRQSEDLRSITNRVDTDTMGNDFQVRQINDKAVVSWKWENVWYTAISNQAGDKLASWVNQPIATAE